MSASMKRLITLVAAILLTSGSARLQAQMEGSAMRGSPAGPNLSGALLKLFGDHKAFSADVLFQIRMASGDPFTSLPGKLAFSEGKSRFEIDLAMAQGGQITPETMAQLKQMGMDKAVTLTLPEKKLSCLIYPGLKAYVAIPLKDADSNSKDADFEVEVTELGKEEVAGHACVKNKVVVTGKDGAQHESTVWNATDLEKFPVKIDTSEEGHNVVLLFTDVRLSKPAASQFIPPPDYAKYDSFMGMMQEIMMKRMRESAGEAPAK